jgi:hypothetical protein
LCHQPDVYSCSPDITFIGRSANLSAQYILGDSILVGGVFHRGSSQGYRIVEQSPESFSERQALLAKKTIGKYWSTGDRPVQVLQGQLWITTVPRDSVIDFLILANIVLSWYLWNHAKYGLSPGAGSLSVMLAHSQIVRRK